MRSILLCGLALLAGCGNVTITQVDAEGHHIKGAQDGFYVPRLMPYLIVADLPPDPITPASAPGGASRTAGHRRNPFAVAPPAAPPAKNNSDQAKPANADTTSTSAGSNSDLSFVALTKLYTIKLVYLPDYSHQQAIKATSGWFGKASLQLQLTDGTLSSFNANNDNTENGEVFKAAMTALITAASGGASGAGAGAAAAKNAVANFYSQDARKAAPEYKKSDAILHPGIYQLHYNDQGVFVRLERVTGFCSQTGYASNPAGRGTSDPPTIPPTDASPVLPPKNPHMMNDDCAPPGSPS